MGDRDGPVHGGPIHGPESSPFGRPARGGGGQHGPAPYGLGQRGPTPHDNSGPPEYGRPAEQTVSRTAAPPGPRPDSVPPGGPPHEASDETMQLGRPLGEERPAQPPVRGPGDGRAARRRAAKRIKRRRRLSATKEIPILIGVALLIALVLKTFLVQAFVIPSGSMEQTIRIGDRVLVDKLTPWFGAEPQRGDVVVFKDPGGWLEGEQKPAQDSPAGIQQGKELLSFIGLLPSDDEQDLIKRAVAVGGDRVQCCDKQGRVTVNGTPLNEPYLHPGNRPSEMKFEVTVPIGRVFVMGDHRSNSADSRFHLRDPHHGTVRQEDVVGTAAVIAWPLGHWRQLEEPETYASVRDAPGAATADGAGNGDNRVTSIPSPAVLPLVMGVVGLSRLRDRPWRKMRSERGGPVGRCALRIRRRRSGRPPS